MVFASVLFTPDAEAITTEGRLQGCRDKFCLRVGVGCYRPTVSDDAPVDDRILGPLNPQQRQAATAVRGPVAILAGAGTGKTTTITHRIAHQVATGAFPATVAAGGHLHREGRPRVAGSPRQPGGTTGRSANLPRGRPVATPSVAAPLRGPRRSPDPGFEGAADRIARERAASTAQVHAAQRAGRRDRMGEEPHGLPRALPRGTGTDGSHAAHPCRTHGGHLPRLRTSQATCRSHRLRRHAGVGGPALPRLGQEQRRRSTIGSRRSRWTSTRTSTRCSRRCSMPGSVIATNSASWATTTRRSTRSPVLRPSTCSASPSATPTRPSCGWRRTTGRRRRSWRSPTRWRVKLGGFDKTLRATVPDGPNPTARPVADTDAEAAFVVQEVRRLTELGVALEQMAVLYRINARSEPFEEAFAAAGIPYQVRDGAFLRRPGPRAIVARLRRASASGPDVVATVEAATDEIGFDPEADPDDTQEVTRQADLGRLRTLAAEYHAHRRRRCRPHRVRRGTHEPVLDGADRSRCQPADLPPSERAGVRRGVPAEAARQGAAVPLPAFGRRPSRGTPAVLRRHHACSHAPLPVMAEGATQQPEPVPAGDRGRLAAYACASNRPTSEA